MALEGCFSDSSNPSGDRLAHLAERPVLGLPPSVCTGSKSTNQDLNRGRCHLLQGRVHVAVKLDLVVQGAQDVGDGALFVQDDEDREAMTSLRS